MGVRAPMPTSVHVLALTHQGRLELARSLGEADLAADEAVGFVAATALHLRSLGTAELWSGDVPSAVRHLLRAIAVSTRDVGINEPAILRVHADAVAGLVSLGRFDEAEALTAELDASTDANHHPWSTAMGLRCHALIEATRGSISASSELLRHALAVHDRLPMPFERARTQLLLGQVLRRAGHRNDARHELAAAHATFHRLGTPVQAAQAAAELASLGGRRQQTNELTPGERRIAELVVAGRTNREVAETTFTSVRTVESHLARIYRKLDVRSRTELAVRLATAPA